MSKTILVTGASGFLGSHLCKNLLEQGHTVTGLDNFFTSARENLHLCEQHDSFSFIEGDIIDPQTVAGLGSYDEIYNLACPASPPHYQKDPVYTMKTSVFGALNLLELAKNTGARIFQASTSEVYGDPEVHPQNEDYVGHVNTLGPRACYDEGKRAAETLFMDYHREYGVDIRIVRIFNTYGPHMDPEDGRVVSNFICQALRGDPITIYGDGSQTRSFCYVDDLINGFITLMNNNKNIIGPVNMGKPGEFTMKELAELVMEITQSSSQVTYHDLPKDDPKKRRPDITKAQSELGWSPQIALKEGLEKTIPWFAQKIGVQNAV